MAGDAVKRKLVTAVMDYLNKENCKRERVVSAFPELTPRNTRCVCSLFKAKTKRNMYAAEQNANKHQCAPRTYPQKTGTEP